MNTTVKYMKKLVKTQVQNSVQPSEPDVVQASTPTGESLSPESVLKCSLLFLEALSHQWISTDAISLTFFQAQNRAKELEINNADASFEYLVNIFNRNRSKSVQDFMG